MSCCYTHYLTTQMNSRTFFFPEIPSVYIYLTDAAAIKIIICMFAPGIWGFQTWWLPAAQSSASGTARARVSMDK